MDYLTVAEMAKLKNCSVQYIQQYCKDGKIQTEQKFNCKGRMKYMIPVSSLPGDLQAKYYAKMKKTPDLLQKSQRKSLKSQQKQRKHQGALRNFPLMNAQD